MGDNEHDVSMDIANVKAKSSKTASEVKDDFAKMQKLKAEALGKVEEMMRNAEKDLEKLEQKITKSRDLAAESKTRLNDELRSAREDIKQKYKELKTRVAQSIVPD